MPGGYALTAHALGANPTNARQLLVSAGLGPFGGQGDSRLLLVALAEGWQEVDSASALAVDAARFDYSGTGRWLGLLTTEGSRLDQYTLLDLQTQGAAGQQLRLPLAVNSDDGVWAPEGDWLALGSQRYLLLYNPTAGYTHFLPFAGDCYTYAWVK
jgi:hypothetical protein